MKPHNTLEEDLFFSVLNQDIQEIKSEIRNFNWDKLFILISEYKPSSLFYHRLKNLKGIPSNFLNQLKYLYLSNLIRNIFLERELFKILSYFQDSSISVVPLKGPVLERYLYNDLGLRSFCDLDLLIRPEDIKEVEKRLEELGYYFFYPYKKADFFHRFRRQIILQKKVERLGMVEIDLHWDLLNDPFLQINVLNNIWKNLRVLSLDGHKIFFLSNEDILIYLSLKSIDIYQFVVLRYIYDIHRLIEIFAKEIDFNRLAKIAKKLNLDLYLFFSLKFSKEFFHTDLPKGFLNSIRPNPLKENLFNLWLNRNNILRFRERIAPTYTWRYLISSYLYARDIFDFLKIVYRRVFISMDEVMELYDQPEFKRSYYIYLKRLLKPISRYPKIKNERKSGNPLLIS